VEIQIRVIEMPNESANDGNPQDDISLDAKHHEWVSRFRDAWQRRFIDR
jgi:hypothetical protein